VDDAASGLLAAFRDLLIRRGERVEDVDLRSGRLDLLRTTGRLRLSIDEDELQELIDDSARLDPDQGISGEENAATVLLIHLDESLATREPHESGWWSYRDGFFHPLPPREAHRQR
jgi:hypothetical protein